MEGLLTRNLPGKRPMSSDPDQIETTCKRCRLSLYKGQRRVWVNEGGILGLCHADPADCDTTIKGSPGA